MFWIEFGVISVQVILDIWSNRQPQEALGGNINTKVIFRRKSRWVEPSWRRTVSRCLLFTSEDESGWRSCLLPAAGPKLLFDTRTSHRTLKPILVLHDKKKKKNTSREQVVSERHWTELGVYCRTAHWSQHFCPAAMLDPSELPRRSSHDFDQGVTWRHRAIS